MYHTAVDIGDYVVVTNARLIQVTGQKEAQKMYYSHSQYPGALKETPYRKLLEQNPTMVRASLSRNVKNLPSLERIVDRSYFVIQS